MKTISARPGIRQRARQAEHEQHFYLRMLQASSYPNIRWLDAGCGHTLIQSWLRDSAHIEREFLSQAAILVGADADWKSLVRDSPIRRVACDLESLAFPNSYFDLITCNMVVEHLKQPSLVFAEFFRVLRSGGKVLILTPNVYHWVNAVSRFTPYSLHKAINRVLLGVDPDDVFPTLYRCNSESSLRSSLKRTGFSTVAIHNLPGRPRLVNLGPLFYPEYLFYRLSLRFSQLREVLCAVAEKPIFQDPGAGRRDPSRPAQRNHPEIDTPTDQSIRMN